MALAQNMQLLQSPFTCRNGSFGCVAEPAMIGSPMPEECTARLQLVAGFNRLAATVVRIQEEARAAHDGPKKQRVLAEAGERFRAGLKVCHT